MHPARPTCSPRLAEASPLEQGQKKLLQNSLARRFLTRFPIINLNLLKFHESREEFLDFPLLICSHNPKRNLRGGAS